MAHEWDSSDYGRRPSDLLTHGRRVCVRCGVEQTRHAEQSWGRVTGYRWWPLAGRCKRRREARMAKESTQ
jgi:hypothetical protein